MTTRASSLDLRMVRQFLAVADTLSFRKAAEQMHMAQPPLSQAIKRLEGLLEARLFERSARGVRLTPAGEVFGEEAGRLLSQAERAMDRTRRAAPHRAARSGAGPMAAPGPGHAKRSASGDSAGERLRGHVRGRHTPRQRETCNEQS